MTKSEKQDPLDEMRDRVLAEALEAATFDGWTPLMLEKSARAVGAEQRLALLFPHGVADLLRYWSWGLDEKMVAAFAMAEPAPKRIRDKVRFLVKTRIEALTPHREAARRASATLALPRFSHLASRLTWSTADAIWRALGDSSTDFNYFTKRATLSAVYLSTLGFWFSDEEKETEEEAYADSWAFLDKRIENIMQFEKFKSKIREKEFSPAKILKPLAKMRYGSR